MSDKPVEGFLLRAADWTHPVGRQILERRSRFDAMFGIAVVRIVFIATNGADVDIHSHRKVNFRESFTCREISLWYSKNSEKQEYKIFKTLRHQDTK